MDTMRTMGFLIRVGLCVAVLVLHPLKTVAGGLTPVALTEEKLIQVKVLRVIMEPSSDLPVVLLADSFEERALPIWIGLFEANAINSEMQGIKHRRPLTHDLLEKILKKTKGTVLRVIITHIKKNSYYATLIVERDGSHIMEIDARPSDSIVLALKFKAPIFVAKKLFTDMALQLSERKGIEEHYGLTIQDLTSALAQSFSFRAETGVLVSDVKKESPAEKDGIKRGDIFVEVGGERVKDVVSFQDALKNSEKAVRARLYRKAHFLSLTLHTE